MANSANTSHGLSATAKLLVLCFIPIFRTVKVFYFFLARIALDYKCGYFLLFSQGKISSCKLLTVHFYHLSRRRYVAAASFK